MTQQSGKFTPGYGGMKFGDNFWLGAKPNPESIVDKLMDGISVSVFGHRRLGKSSLLAEARERLRSIGKNVIWVNLDSEDSLIKALSAIMQSMNQGREQNIVASIKNWVENTDMFPSEFRAGISALIAGRIDSSSELYSDNYSEALFREIGQRIKTQKPEDKPIIIFDELTILLSNTIKRGGPGDVSSVVARLNSFLGMLRNWRSDDFGITMAVSGSISMDWLQRNHGIRSDSINDCLPMWIEVMEREDAKDLIAACVEARPPKNWSNDCTEELLDILPAYFPGTVQLAFSEIYSEDASLENLKGQLRKKVNKALWKEYYSQFDSSFFNYSEVERNSAVRLFDELAMKEGEVIRSGEAQKILNVAAPEGQSVDGAFLLHCLILDSFLELEPEGVQFTSGLVPAWHKMKFT